jgi:hypothetical protein
MDPSSKRDNYTRRDILQYGGVEVATIGTLPTGVERAQPGNGIERTLIPADPDSGFHFPYYLYAPNTVNDEKRPLLVNPNHSTTNPNDTTEQRRERDIERAEGSMRSGAPRHIADDLNVPLLIPVFSVRLAGKDTPIKGMNEEEEKGYEQYGFAVHALPAGVLHISEGRWERVDLQLLRMVEHATDVLQDASYPVADADEFIMSGFSSAGNFVNRFTALHPTRVQSVTAGGINGIGILPISEAKGHTLNYPLGVADFKSLTGQPFNVEAFKNVSQYIYMGSADDHDPRGRLARWDPDSEDVMLEVYGQDIHDERLPYVQSVHEEVGTSAVFRMYDGVGHTITDEMHDDIVAFHEQQIGTDYSDIDVEYVVERSIGREITNTVLAGGAGAITGLGAVGYALKQRMNQRGD